VQSVLIIQFLPAQGLAFLNKKMVILCSFAG
jgi:hypothetical protein